MDIVKSIEFAFRKEYHIKLGGFELPRNWEHQTLGGSAPMGSCSSSSKTSSVEVSAAITPNDNLKKNGEPAAASEQGEDSEELSDNNMVSLPSRLRAPNTIHAVLPRWCWHAGISGFWYDGRRCRRHAYLFG